MELRVHGREEVTAKHTDENTNGDGDLYRREKGAKAGFGVRGLWYRRGILDPKLASHSVEDEGPGRQCQDAYG